MGKAKTRARKKTVKKGIKRQIKQKKGGTSLSGEQQARINEMMKTMLMRAPQVIQPGQIQQNDKQQQQIDSLNKLIDHQRKETERLSAHLKERKQIYEDAKEEQRIIKDETKHADKTLKLKEEKLKEKEKLEKRRDEKQAKVEELDKKLKEYDGRTKEGKHKKEIENIKTERSRLTRDIENLDREIKENTLYNEWKRESDEVEILRTRVAAKQQIINSPEFKNPSKELTQKMTQLLEQQHKEEVADEVLKQHKKLLDTQARTVAQEKYLESLNRPRSSKKDDTLMNEYKAKLAEQIDLEQKNQIELDKVNAKYENTTDLIKKANRKAVENQNMAEELARQRNAIESEEYINRLKQNEQLSKQVVTQELANEQMRNANAQRKKLMELEARNIVANEFDPENTSPAVVYTQMDEYTKQVIDGWTNYNKQFNEGIDHRNAQMRMDAAFESVLGRYDKGTSELANSNLMKMFDVKTDTKLSGNLKEWNTRNTEKATEFLELINSLDPNILTDEESLIGFVNSDEFKNFKW